MKPLEGIRVLDASRVLTGPFCSMLLGDLGAEVLKIERPHEGDDTRKWGPPFISGESAYFLSVNRNKKSVTLDLTSMEGREIFYSLSEKSDVFIENFRPGVTERLGIDYEKLSKRNQRLIYCSITSFGQTGIYRDRLAYDIILQGMGGIMGVTGEPNGPPVRVGVAISDIGAGMYGAISILAALNAREKTGRGQWVDVSLLDSTVSWMTYMAGYYFATGTNPPKMGSAHPTVVPYQSFETADDDNILLAIGNDKLFRELCIALGIQELADDPSFSTNAARVTNRTQLIKILEVKFLTKTKNEWLQELTKAGIPIGPVYSLSELFADKQVLQREMLLEINHPKAGSIKQIGIPMKFSETQPKITSPPPLLGQNTDEVLRSILRFGEERISDLKRRGIV